MLDQIFESEAEQETARQTVFLSSWGIAGLSGVAGVFGYFPVTDALLVMGLMIANMVLLDYDTNNTIVFGTEDDTPEDDTDPAPISEAVEE